MGFQSIRRLHKVKKGAPSDGIKWEGPTCRRDVAPCCAHGAAKAAVTWLMTSLVLEGAPHKIRANTISPGPIEHPLTQSALVDPDHPMSKLVAKIPLGRMGQPREVAYLALFLAWDESSFITGAKYCDRRWSHHLGLKSRGHSLPRSQEQ